MPDGLTKSFLPAVSPDGHFVAAYVAGQESSLVTFTMLDVDIPDDLRARIGSFTSPYAALKGISQSDGNVEMVFSVTGTYSFSAPDQVREEPNGQQVRCTILFDRPLARDPRSPD